MATDLSVQQPETSENGAAPQATMLPKQKITYATLGAPDPELHRAFDQALERVRAGLGQTHPMFIGGKPVTADSTFEDRSPINRNWLLGYFQKGTAEHACAALSAARDAFPAWSHTPWQERVRILRRAAALIESRIYDLSALASLEAGKNRLEAIGDVQEAADLIYYYCDQFEDNDGFVVPMRAESPKHSNTSVLRPHGVWVVISPFNFPFALAGGPSGAALVAGNTVVFKPASDTTFAGFEIARCFLDAGVPEGVFNLVTGPGSTVGNELATNPQVDGMTFTGSYEVGMQIYRAFAAGRRPRPCITEMGGKNPAIVSRQANLDLAAMGVMRSAFGLQGQKCSACSRVLVERLVQEAFLDKLLALTRDIHVGDPTQQDVWLGPVINESAYRNYADYCQDLGRAGRIRIGGQHLTTGELGKGYYCAPTIVDQLPVAHRLWKHEMFVPITIVTAVDSLDEAMRLANDTDYGLTAGFFSTDPGEIEWFFDHIQAGVTYVNRKSGATTGAWPAYQGFGGWKASGSTGKAAGSVYYVQQFMREQSRTVIEE